MDKKQPEALRRSTAADGKTELFNLPGYPLMVRAADFNRIHTESEMRRTALLDEMQKATPTAEQQAAPKAAPVTQQAGYAEVIECGNSYAKVKLKGEAFGSTKVGDIFYTAPKQEAQEPVAYVHVPHYTVEGKVRPVVSFEKYQQDYADGIYSTRIPLYAAPQPAPAPLSEMPYEKRKAIQEGEQISASDAWFKARHEMLDTVDRRNVFRAGFDRGWNAAIAAQGGK